MLIESEPQASALLGVYRQPPQRFVRGEGCELIDAEGARYLDFTAGIAVTALGHGSPVVRQAIERALDTGLVHTSNLFRTEPGEALARRLTAASGLDYAFLCNSGGEAVEGSMKFARRWAGTLGLPEKRGFVALRGAFHGRLFGSLALTDKPAYQEPFLPLMPGVVHVDVSDDGALDRALDPERVAALILEPIQGESGIQVIPDAQLRRMRAITRERGIALILDEIQCGMGRTGALFAHQSAAIRPDLLVLAKPIGGGLPMGVVLLSEEIAQTLQPGDHGTTFGGGPLVSTVALAVLDALEAPGFMEEVREKGETLRNLLQGIADRNPDRVMEIRGRGLMLGVALHGEAAPVVDSARDRGLLLVAAGPRVLRILPPLVISQEEMKRGAERLEQAILDAGGER